MRSGVRQAVAARVPVLVEVVGMIGLIALVVSALLALAVAVVPAAETASVPAAISTAEDSAAVAAEPPVPAAVLADSFVVAADTALVFVVSTGSRLYPNWKEERRVRLQEPFVIGDTENVATITKLLPDFRIIDGKPRSISPTLANPAVRIFVHRGGAPVDSTWAFLNFPPHMSPKSFFTFQLKEIVGWKGPVGTPVVPIETTPSAAADAPSKRGE